MNFAMIIKSNYKKMKLTTLYKLSAYLVKRRIFFVIVALRPTVVQGLLVHDVSRTHNDEPHSVALPRRRECCLTTQHSQEANILALGGIRTCTPNKQATIDPRLTPRGHLYRPIQRYMHILI